MSTAILGIAEAAKLIATKKLSPVELTQACLDRVDAMNDVLHAFILPTPERAIADAKAAEAAIMKRGPFGPMHGIPIGLKDIVDTAGIPTTCQSKILQDNIPETDATCAAKLATARMLDSTTASHSLGETLGLGRVTAREIYATPAWLWATPIAIFLFSCRIWVLSHRGRMTDDPVAFALRDRVSLGLGVFAAISILLAL